MKTQQSEFKFKANPGKKSHSHMCCIVVYDYSFSIYLTQRTYYDTPTLKLKVTHFEVRLVIEFVVTAICSLCSFYILYLMKLYSCNYCYWYMCTFNGQMLNQLQCQFIHRVKQTFKLWVKYFNLRFWESVYCAFYQWTIVFSPYTLNLDLVFWPRGALIKRSVFICSVDNYSLL